MKNNNSMRGRFAHELFKLMKTNKKIYIITGDLGYGVWDDHKLSYPNRVINVGAAEQAMMGVGVGLALEGKIPIVYSMSSFVLYRPFETIRNYVNYERIPVKLIGSGRNRDYLDHGFCHWAEEDKKIMAIFENIEAKWPESAEEIQSLTEEMIKSNKPWYLNLKR
jgi:transketolase